MINKLIKLSRQFEFKLALAQVEDDMPAFKDIKDIKSELQEIIESILGTLYSDREEALTYRNLLDTLDGDTSPNRRGGPKVFPKDASEAIVFIQKLDNDIREINEKFKGDINSVNLTEVAFKLALLSAGLEEQRSRAGRNNWKIDQDDFLSIGNILSSTRTVMHDYGDPHRMNERQRSAYVDTVIQHVRLVFRAVALKLNKALSLIRTAKKLGYLEQGTHKIKEHQKKDAEGIGVKIEHDNIDDFIENAEDIDDIVHGGKPLQFQQAEGVLRLIAPFYNKTQRPDHQKEDQLAAKALSDWEDPIISEHDWNLYVNTNPEEERPFRKYYPSMRSAVLARKIHNMVGYRNKNKPMPRETLRRIHELVNRIQSVRYHRNLERLKNPILEDSPVSPLSADPTNIYTIPPSPIKQQTVGQKYKSFPTDQSILDFMRLNRDKYDADDRAKISLLAPDIRDQLRSGQITLDDALDTIS